MDSAFTTKNEMQAAFPLWASRLHCDCLPVWSLEGLMAEVTKTKGGANKMLMTRVCVPQHVLSLPGT